jgi:VWFA-related protein
MTARLLGLALLASAVLQQQSPPQTTIRSGVELLRLNVTAVDENGQPVRDLGPDDFSVEIDGKPRRVSFARFYGPDSPGAAPSIPAAASPSSFVSNVGSAPGRVVVLVVDVESMHPGYEKLVLDTAGAMIDQLSPEDSAGLLVLPGGGVELTRDHRRVRDALRRLRGFAASRPFQEHVISVAEAEAFQRGDVRVKREVIERECANPPTAVAQSSAPSGSLACPSQLEQQARAVLFEADRRIRSVLSTLTALNTRMKSFEAPKTLILLSAGLPFRVEAMGRFRDLQKQAAESGTTTYIVQLDQPQTDASSPTGYGASVVKQDLHEGLATIAQVTEGTLSAGVGPARGVFERIHTEIAHTYQLGVESLPSDADGKPHDVVVKVRRERVTVRSRRELIVSPEPRPALTPVRVLEQPTDLAEAPLAAAAYTTRGDDETTLKVIVLVELLSAAPGAARPSYAFNVMKGDKPIFQTADEMVVEPGGARAVVAAQLAPGEYRLRVAAVDGGGRAGSVELPLEVALRQAGTLQFSTLLVGTAADQFAPASHFTPGSASAALLELYAADPSHFDSVTVDLEVRRAGEEAVLARGPLTVHKTPQPGRRIAEGAAPIGALPPGTYVVSAVVRKPGHPGGRVSSTIRVVNRVPGF